MEQILANPKIAVIRPEGSLNAANALKFARELTTAIVENDCSILLVDFERVEFIDSHGLIALVSALKMAQSLGRRLSLCSVSPAIKIIFELTQLDQVFEISECHDGA
ncbi:MAG: STAS domain-containing protein [Heteroscytonema crispum UTEX LB 1556]